MYLTHCYLVWKFTLYLFLSLSCRDMSNNTFNASNVPLWFSTLTSLTTLYASHPFHVCLEFPCACYRLKFILFSFILKMFEWSWTARVMENTALQGEVPAAIFGLPQLQTVLVPFIFFARSIHVFYWWRFHDVPVWHSFSWERWEPFYFCFCCLTEN